MGQIGEFTPEQDGSDALYELLRAPLTEEDATKIADQNGRIEGVVAIGLTTLVNSDAESFLDELNDLLVEIPLMDISYEVVGWEDRNILHIKVSGEVEIEPENVPCQKCGRDDLPLHTNYQCPECHTPETRVISLQEMQYLLKEYPYHYGDVSYLADTNDSDQIILSSKTDEEIHLRVGTPPVNVLAYKTKPELAEG